MSGDDRTEAAGAVARAAGGMAGGRGAGDAEAGALAALGAVEEARRAWRTAGAVEMGRLTEAVRGADDALASPVPGPGPAGGWTRKAGLAGAAIGVVAAGVALERLTVHRAVRRKARLALDSSGPYGSLRGTPGTAYAEDGTALYFEVDEPAAFADEPTGTTASGDGALGEGTGGVAGDRGDERGDREGDGGERGADGSVPEGSRGRLLRLLRRTPSAEESGAGAGARAGEPPLTVVFSHGYCLNQDVWHFQRAALRGAVRAVYWDQRSHGRSARAPAGEPVSIDLLGRDLKAVLDAAVPEGPVVLVGHSMGGMTVMALAEQYPEYVAERVAGVGFLGTSAGGLAEVTYGLPAAGVRAVRRLVPGVLRALGSQSELVERGRRATADLFAGVVKRYSFGSVGEVDPGVARFAERLIESVPVDVVAEFYPAFAEHEKTGALSAFDELPALVLAGDRDLLTPSEHSERIAGALPDAAFVILEATGHLLMLERPERVNEHVAALLARTIRTHGSTARPAPRTSSAPGSGDSASPGSPSSGGGRGRQPHRHRSDR